MKNTNLIVVLVGVCGTGKSAIGQKIARNLAIPFFDAEKLPTFQELPESKLPQDINLEKWLLSIEELIVKQSTLKGCVISCSVLKKEHRKMLTANIDHELDWIFMKGSYEDVIQRIQQTGDHDRPAALLKADFETFEAPQRALTIDINHSEQDIINTILKYLVRKYE